MSDLTNLRRGLHMLTLGAAAAEKVDLTEDFDTPGEVSEPEKKNLIPKKMQDEADRIHKNAIEKWAASKEIQGFGLGEKVPGEKGNLAVKIRNHAAEVPSLRQIHGVAAI